MDLQEIPKAITGADRVLVDRITTEVWSAMRKLADRWVLTRKLSYSISDPYKHGNRNYSDVHIIVDLSYRVPLDDASPTVDVLDALKAAVAAADDVIGSGDDYPPLL